MNRAGEQYRLPDRLDVDAPVLVLTGTDGQDFTVEGDVWETVCDLADG